MNYMGASINQSPAIAELAGTKIENGAFLLVKYNNDGNVVLCDTEGELAAGILLPETSNITEINEDVTVQIKDIGLCKAGAAIKKGMEVMTDTQGRCIPAVTGKFVIGYAVTSASGADEVVEVDIKKSGYKA